MKETIAMINKTKSWFFEKINKIDKPLADSSRKKGRRLKQSNLTHKGTRERKRNKTKSQQKERNHKS